MRENSQSYYVIMGTKQGVVSNIPAVPILRMSFRRYTAYIGKLKARNRSGFILHFIKPNGTRKQIVFQW